MKKHFSLITVFILMFSLFFTLSNNVKSAHATSPAIVHNGTFEGTDINYALDENGVLTISGIGAIPDYVGEESELQQWKDNITELVIENGITVVGYAAFDSYDKLTKVTLADSVQAIYDLAFCACIKLKSVDMPRTMSEIRLNAFAWCTSLEEIELPSGITKLSGGLFSNCTNLKSVVIPDTVQEFGTNIFGGCENLKSIRLPKNIAKIDKKYSFNGSSIERFYIPCDCNFEFDPSEYVISYVNGEPSAYLSNANVEVLDSHNFGAWEDVGNKKQQRRCDCGVTETRDATSLGEESQQDAGANKHKSKTKNDEVSFGVALVVVGVIFVLAIGTMWLARRGRERNYH